MQAISKVALRKRSGLSLAVLFVAAALLIPGCERASTEQARAVTSDVAPILDSPPTTTFDDVYEQAAELFKNSGSRHEVEQKLKAKFDQLGETIARRLRGLSPPRPVWISPEFKGKGIDRGAEQARFADGTIAANRWIADSKQPVITGEEAFAELIENLMADWRQANQFGIEFRIYSLKTSPEGHLFAKVVADVFGQISENVGLQTTGIWRTEWIQDDADDLQLLSVEAIAQERISVDVPNGQIWQDCTAAIAGDCSSWSAQLYYGLDALSRRYPNIDVNGNHGLAAGDLNGDGLEDLYICQGHGLPNVLLIQNADGTVSDAANVAGVDVLDETRAVLMIDVDNDRDQDLLLSTHDKIFCLLNDGQGVFKPQWDFPTNGQAYSLNAADYDRDGLLDFFACCRADRSSRDDLAIESVGFGTPASGVANLLFRGNGDGSFQDVSQSSGILGVPMADTISAMWIDVDDDTDVDLFVANETRPNRLFENREGTFVDVASQHFGELSGPHRSVSTGDFNQDGKLDLFIATNVSNEAYRTVNGLREQGKISPEQRADRLRQSYFLLSRNAADAQTVDGSKFGRYSLQPPLFSAESSFGSAVVDLNNDGFEDVVVANGYLSRQAIEDLEPIVWDSVNPLVDVPNSGLTAGDAEMMDLVRGGIVMPRIATQPVLSSNW